jgi:ABC-2 type transport system permease protein
MNSESLAEVRVEPTGAGEVPLWRRFSWSVRREIWEHRSIYLAPLAVAALIVVGSAISLIRLPATLRAAAALDAIHREAAVEQHYVFAALLLMFTTMVVGVLYCLDALHGERRDRGILFWKSLPVSDATTVLVKATVPLFILPLVTFAVTVATQAVMLLLAGAWLTGSGLSVWALLPFGRMTAILLAHLVLGHGLWYAPFWGWLLLVSAWSRRVPLLWAVLPPLAIGLVEKIAFDTSYFADFLGHRLMGGSTGMASGRGPAITTMASITPAAPAQIFASPEFWLGLAVTAVFLALAVRLRRRHGPV